MGVESHGQEHGEDCTGTGCPLLEENTRRNGSTVAAVELERDEDDNEYAKSENTAPDFGVVPWVDAAAPLEGEEQTDDGTDKEKGAEEIDLSDLLACGKVAMFANGVLENEEDDGNGTAAERQVDPGLIR